MTDRNVPRVLVFCRDYLIDDFRQALGPHASDYDFHYLTDGSYVGVSDTRSRFYARLATATRQTNWNEGDEDDVIARCRLLRGLPRAQSLRMLRAMLSILVEEFDAIDPVMVYAQMVDEYVTHLVSEVARRRGIVYAGICYSYFPEKIQATRYWMGAPCDFRAPDRIEAESTLETISPHTFRQNYQMAPSYDRLSHLMAVSRYWLKRAVFPLLGRLKRDSLNIHYACLPFVAERRRLGDYPTSSWFHGDWRERLARAKELRGVRAIYLPLGYFPESTIDYWVGNRLALDYENLVVEICEALAGDHVVLVKEHTHMLGARDPMLYRRLSKIPGLINIPPFEFSNDALAASDAVLLGGGSIGVEAHLRDKPVFTFCDTSYWFEPTASVFIDLSRIVEWPDVIGRALASSTRNEADDKVEFVRKCLASTLRLEKVGKTWPIPVQEDLSLLLKTCCDLPVSKDT